MALLAGIDEAGYGPTLGPLIVTGVAMVFLYIRYPVRYRRYRNVLLATTSLALIGFVTFPLMPPRLLNAGGPYGATLAEYTFVDTLAEVGGLWSFDSETMQAISNQWAAMPSLHISWAMWCTVALYPVLRSATARVAIVLYPVLTLYAIVVTANHYWIDAVGGAAILWAGWHIGTRASRWIAPRVLAHATESDRRSPGHSSTAGPGTLMGNNRATGWRSAGRVASWPLPSSRCSR